MLNVLALVIFGRDKDRDLTALECAPPNWISLDSFDILSESSYATEYGIGICSSLNNSK